MDSAWIEEGQTLSVNSLTTLKPTIRKKGSKVIATWNPRYADDAIDDFFRGSTIPEKSLVIPVNYYDNPWLTDELRSDMLYDRAKDISLYEHVWLGGYENSSDSRVFKNWTIREFEAPNEVVHRLGADFGFAVDPTTLVRCHLIGDKQLYVDYEAYGEQTEIDELPDLFAEVPESSKWPMAADSSRPETISYLRNHGFPHVHGTVKGPGSAMEGVKFLQSFDIIVHPRCERMIIALQRYKFKTDSRTNKVLPILLHEKSDMIDALRYAAESVRRATGQNQNPDGRPPQGRRWR
jgi:phage terminase large subunit